MKTGIQNGKRSQSENQEGRTRGKDPEWSVYRRYPRDVKGKKDGHFEKDVGHRVD